MKRMKTFWNNYINLGYDGKILDKCRQDINIDNLHSVKQVSCLLIIILVILTFFYTMFDDKPVRNILCIVMAVVMLGVFWVSSYLLRNAGLITSKKTDFIIDIFSALCFTVAIYLGTFAAGDEMAVPTVWMFFFAILIFDRMPLRNLAVVAISGIVFAVCSYMVKRPYIFKYDMMHAVTSILGAAYASWLKSRMKVQNILALMRLKEANIEIMETVEEQEREAELLRHRANRDELTGLYKKDVFQERVRDILDTSEQHVMHALICVDVDNFKEINDNYGHMFGDSVLKRITEILTSGAGKESLAGRFGGDEFFVFFSNISGRSEMDSYLQYILNEGKTQNKLDGKEVQISISAGLACYPENGTTYRELFVAADKALYKAKKEGKGTYRWF